ncbi:MAG TPA: Na+/H+ antiporter NhaA [Vicinamibacterales bacterium]|jgi:NhaA family Na+:H+ antiporter|nr:Na+/H+ antiporter NhaA [Vicinamibacterales bacterium]
MAAMTHDALTHRTSERPLFRIGRRAPAPQPHPKARRASAPLGRFPRLSHFAVEYLLALPGGALIGLLWANLAGESYFWFAHQLSFVVNDLLMVFFFALVTKEIVEATAPGGVLHPWQRAVLPAAAGAGATIVPPLLFVAYIRAVDAPMFVRAWPVTLASDLALGYFVLRTIFGRHPAIPFYLLLAIAANGLGFLALATGTIGLDLSPGIAIVLLAAALGNVMVLRLARVKSLWPYVVAGGGPSWIALFWGGFHPALALAPIVFFLPHAPRDPGFFVDAPSGARDTLSNLERFCRTPAQIALFLFGLVNAGVPLRGLEAGMWALPLATLVGKPLGIAAVSLIGLAAGMRLPHGLGWRDLPVIGVAAGIGFTMALFFATSTLAPGQILTETKMGALVSVAGVGLVYLLARMLRVGRFAQSKPSR